MPARVLAGAMCVQRFDDSLKSAIHITYRISLRSSSMPEPRDPLLKVLIHFMLKSHSDKAATENHEHLGPPAGAWFQRDAGAVPPKQQVGKVNMGVWEL